MDALQFPSPTGVNYYEYLEETGRDSKDVREFPSPTGVNYYEFCPTLLQLQSSLLFPSPTGVNYYELSE